MKAKAKIILDLDNYTIQSIEFKDNILNMCPMTDTLKREIYKKVARTGVGNFTFVPNSSLDPIGYPYLLLEGTLEVFPKIYTDETKYVDFKYKCVLNHIPVVNPIPYEKYSAMREKYVSGLVEKIKDIQESAIKKLVIVNQPEDLEGLEHI